MEPTLYDHPHNVVVRNEKKHFPGPRGYLILLSFPRNTTSIRTAAEAMFEMSNVMLPA
jgi:hypothetical protein